MAKKLSKRAALVTSATLLLLLLCLVALGSNSRLLLPTGPAGNDQLRPVSLTTSRAGAAAETADEGGSAAAVAAAEKKKELPESWGREVGFRPGVKLPNLGRTQDGWAGVHRESGTRSPYYGDIQRSHQDWLLLRAKEMRSGVVASSAGGVDGGWSTGTGDAAGETHDGKDPSRDDTAVERPPLPPPPPPEQEEQEEQEGKDEAVGGTVVGTHYEGGGVESVDSEDWTNAVAAGGGRGLHSSRRGGGSGLADGAGPGAVADNGNPESRTERRSLRRQGSRQRHSQGRTAYEAEAGAPAPPTSFRLAAPESRPEQAEQGVSAPRERAAVGGAGEAIEAPRTTRTLSTALSKALSTTTNTQARRRRTDAGGWAWGWGWGRPQGESAEAMERKERVRRLERGAELWGGTYVPPIEPKRRRDLVNKWSSRYKKGDDGGEAGAGRILYVISSYDRGKRLGRDYRQVDKLDYILMMMDEMREACELGFSPQVHLIAAWDPSEVSKLIQDRLFCRRTGDYVPYTFEEHPPSVRNNLAIKHRIYMKPRLQDFDVFLQTEDDMVVTLNHFLLYQEECDYLEKRIGLSGTKGRPNVFVPGFMRVEAGGEEWYEWEIVLSRFKPVKIYGAGTYMTLVPSRVLPRAGNNQGMWMATQGQLEAMAGTKGCQYLDFDVTSTNGMPETHSGSIQMFHRECGFEKVFPATHFEDFIVHHRTNNKNGRRGESIPGVSMAMLRVWAEQFIRDGDFLQVRHWTLLP